MFETTCNGIGIFSMGNINPLNINVGNIVAIKEISIACCCVFTKMEIKIPINKFVKIKIVLTNNSKIRLPLIGKSSKK